MLKLTTAAQMREMDRRTTEDYGVPGIVLMENAALRVVDVIAERFGPLSGKRIAVVCGKGNNGGDGLAIARHLAVRFGAGVTVHLASDPGDYTGDAAVNYKMAQAFGLSIRSDAPRVGDGGADLIVDALLGTGIKGAVEGSLAEAIQAMNNAHAPIVSVDVPSGLNADTGEVNGACVQAALTVTFALPKIGLMVYPGAEYAGELIVADIGMPRAVMAADEVKVAATEASDVAKWLPARVNGRDSNKGKFGHVTVFAGSAGFAGAPTLSAEAAARTGAGLVTLAVPKGIQNALMAGISPVVMTQGLSETPAGTFSREAVEAALKLAAKGTAAALGPGLGGPGKRGDPRLCPRIRLALSGSTRNRRRRAELSVTGAGSRRFGGAVPKSADHSDAASRRNGPTAGKRHEIGSKRPPRCRGAGGSKLRLRRVTQRRTDTHRGARRVFGRQHDQQPRHGDRRGRGCPDRPPRDSARKRDCRLGGRRCRSVPARPGGRSDGCVSGRACGTDRNGFD